MGPPRQKYIYRNRPRRARQGYSRVLTGYSRVLMGTQGCSRVLTGYSRGTHGCSRVLTGAHGYSRVLTGAHGCSPEYSRAGTHGFSRVLTGYSPGYSAYLCHPIRQVLPQARARVPLRLLPRVGPRGLAAQRRVRAQALAQSGTVPRARPKWERPRLRGRGRGYIHRPPRVAAAGLRRRRSTLGFGTSTAAATAPCARPTCVGRPWVPGE